jgi:small-conductance mechanosensitive channel
MIADAVAGIYLLRDPDFEAGDTVRVGDMEGVVESIELRKTRFAVANDTVVRGNADIEARWTKVGNGDVDTSSP